MPSDRDRALAIVPELRAIRPQLETYEHLLRRWQARINLVGQSTLDHLWTRHFADSGQLLALKPDARRWIDLGSGAGFPGMVIALLLRGSNTVSSVQLVENDTRKAAFLREVSRETGAGAEIIVNRAEAIAGGLCPDVVTSRAMTPVETLVDLVRSWLDSGATGLFLTGAADPAPSRPGLCIKHGPSRVGPGFVVTVSRGDSGQD